MGCGRLALLALCPSFAVLVLVLVFFVLLVVLPFRCGGIIADGRVVIVFTFVTLRGGLTAIVRVLAFALLFRRRVLNIGIGVVLLVRLFSALCCIAVAVLSLVFALQSKISGITLRARLGGRPMTFVVHVMVMVPMGFAVVRVVVLVVVGIVPRLFRRPVPRMWFGVVPYKVAAGVAAQIGELPVANTEIGAVRAVWRVVKNDALICHHTGLAMNEFTAVGSVECALYDTKAFPVDAGVIQLSTGGMTAIG